MKKKKKKNLEKKKKKKKKKRFCFGPLVITETGHFVETFRLFVVFILFHFLYIFVTQMILFICLLKTTIIDTPSVV